MDKEKGFCIPNSMKRLFVAFITDLNYYRILAVIISWIFIMASCKGADEVRIIHIALDKSHPDVNCYTAILPENTTTDAYLILIPGFGESSSDVLEATTLPYEAVKENIAVFIPTLQNGTESYGFSPQSQIALMNIMRDIQQRFNLQKKDFYIGGFSMGGSTAIKFAETAEIKPVCVFAIDSPLDFERFYYSTKRDVEIYKKGIAEGDSIYVKLLNDIGNIMGGSPRDHIENYYRISPFSLSDTTHQAIIPLKNLPIRVYIEPAEQWWLDNRQTDVLGLNILDATAFINDLRLLGNDRAELITTNHKGFRNKGKNYHPHSWTIVDNSNLIQWMKACKAQ